MDIKANRAAASVPKLLDPVTTDTAVSILRTLIASAAAERQASDCEDCDARAVPTQAVEPADGMTAPKPAVKSAEVSAAEAKALQPHIVVEEKPETVLEEEPKANKRQKQEERHSVTAARYLGDVPDIQEDAALELLLDGLRNGRLIAVFLDDIATVEIPAAFWATEAGRATARQGYSLKRCGDLPGAGFVNRRAIVSKNDVYGLMGAAKPRNRGGRPVEYDWEEIMFDIWAYASDCGIPKTQAQFFRDVASFLGDRAPESETVLKERTDRVFKAMVSIQQMKVKSQNS